MTIESLTEKLSFYNLPSSSKELNDLLGKEGLLTYLQETSIKAIDEDDSIIEKEIEKEKVKMRRKIWCQKVEEEPVFEFSEETMSISEKDKRIAAEAHEMRVHEFKEKARIARQNNHVKNLKALSIVRASLSDELKIKGIYVNV